MKKYEQVSIIVGMRNSGTTIVQMLESVLKQKYPIREIIVIDNKSKDNSVALALSVSKKSKIPIKVIIKKEDRGIGSSYNFGVKMAHSSFVVLMHSDVLIISENELEKLTKPFRDDPKTIASYPKLLLPKEIWQKYNFWQKCLFARAVGVEIPAMNGKFDCLKKEVFERLGGSDEKNFGEKILTGGEDADLHLRLKRVGKVVPSEAKIIHLHYLGDDYRLSDWVKNRKTLAKSYGTFIKLRVKDPLVSTGILIVLVKPVLTILPFIPYLHFVGIILLIVYAFLNSRKMYLSFSTLLNPRIILLPFIEIFLIYYETFWMIDAFVFTKKQV